MVNKFAKSLAQCGTMVEENLDETDDNLYDLNPHLWWFRKF